MKQLREKIRRNSARTRMTRREVSTQREGHTPLYPLLLCAHSLLSAFSSKRNKTQKKLKILIKYFDFEFESLLFFSFLLDLGTRSILRTIQTLFLGKEREGEEEKRKRIIVRSEMKRVFF